MHQGKAMRGADRKAAVCNPGKESSPEPDSVEALILDF